VSLPLCTMSRSARVCVCVCVLFLSDELGVVESGVVCCVFLMCCCHVGGSLSHRGFVCILCLTDPGEEAKDLQKMMGSACVCVYVCVSCFSLMDWVLNVLLCLSDVLLVTCCVLCLCRYVPRAGLRIIINHSRD
jgi:hypothetical protein